MKDKERGKVVTTTVPKDVYDKIEKIADRQIRTIADVVRKLIIKGLKK